tara:strand:- start:4090 stop:4866 length:777 start_codon:yes stop_codon:yes gene_type:complete
MLEKTRELRREFRRIVSYSDKLEALEGAYAGKDCFLLAPGPSLGHVQEQELRDKASGQNIVVMSVKQAYTPYKDITDFHFINDCNLPMINGYPGYMYSVKRGPIVVASSGYSEEHARTRFAPAQHWDLFCKVLDPLVYPQNNLGRLCENYEFERGTYDKMLDRPCGPSITMETVIYMAVHTGVKNIYAFGWDSGAKVGEHFYDGATHLTSNRNFEYEMVQKGSGPLYNWLKTRDIGLHLVSEVSALSEQIPRIKLGDL